jgi:hypothetical protein
MISGFNHSVNEAFALLGCFTALIGSFRINRLYQNIGNWLPISASEYLRRAKNSKVQ